MKQSTEEEVTTLMSKARDGGEIIGTVDELLVLTLARIADNLKDTPS